MPSDSAHPIAYSSVGSYRCTMTGEHVLRSTRSILLVDFPGREVSDTLTRAGFAVMAHGGPGPQDYFQFELDGQEVRGGEDRTGSGAGGPRLHAPTPG
jgi:hypothetical protein